MDHGHCPRDGCGYPAIRIGRVGRGELRRGHFLAGFDSSGIHPRQTSPWRQFQILQQKISAARADRIGRTPSPHVCPAGNANRPAEPETRPPHASCVWCMAPTAFSPRQTAARSEDIQPLRGDWHRRKDVLGLCSTGKIEIRGFFLHPRSFFHHPQMLDHHLPGLTRQMPGRKMRTMAYLASWVWLTLVTTVLTLSARRLLMIQRSWKATCPLFRMRANGAFARVRVPVDLYDRFCSAPSPDGHWGSIPINLSRR